MKKLVILVVVGVGLFKAYGFYKVESLPPIYDHPYVVVYGRDSCGFTQRTRSALEEAGINFEYYSVDDKSVADTLHKRMEQSGIDARRYLLPVVDVNNTIEIRPDNSDLIQKASGITL